MSAITKEETALRENRRVFFVVFFFGGDLKKLITDDDQSTRECAMTDVDVKKFENVAVKE